MRALSRPVVAATLLGGTLLLASCGEPPRPFSTGSAPPADLVRLSTASLVTIAPVTDLAPEYSRRAAMAMTIAFAGAAMPARIGTGQDAPGYRVVGRRETVGPDEVLTWQAFGPDGHPLAERRMPLPAVPESDRAALIESLAAEAATPLVRAIETDMDRPLEDRMAAPPPRPLPGQTPTLILERARTAPVAVLDITGLPPRETQILRSALESQLRRGGHITDISASWRITGTIKADPLPASDPPAPGGPAVLLRVSWTISSIDGTEAGTIEQANPVPISLMDSQFPAIAVAIAEGGAQGIDEVLVETLSKAASTTH